MTRLYEAGCSEGLISAITGHNIETCRRNLGRDFVRTREASKKAIRMPDENRSQTCNRFPTAQASTRFRYRGVC